MISRARYEGDRRNDVQQDVEKISTPRYSLTIRKRASTPRLEIVPSHPPSLDIWTRKRATHQHHARRYVSKLVPIVRPCVSVSDCPGGEETCSS